MPETVVHRRRELRFNSLDEIVAEAERWTDGSYHTLGNWSCGQILRHLAQAAHCALDGFGFQASWFIRTVAPLVKHSYLTRRMKPGFRLPRRAKSLQPGDAVSTEQGIAELKAALARYVREVPSHPHPVFGTMTAEEWTNLHCRHAELHMSFVVARDG